MAGVKHFYIGTYEEGVSPGDPSEWGADIYAVQQKFYRYFSTQQEETDCEIIACADIVINYVFCIGGNPSSSDNRIKWSDMPEYCDNLKYTSDKYLEGTGVRRIRQTEAPQTTIVVGAFGRKYQKYNPLIIEGFQIEHNEGATTYGDKSTVYYYMGWSDTSGLANQHVAPVIFKNCRISKTTSYTGNTVNYEDYAYHVTTPDGTANLQFINCVIYTWSLKAVNIQRYCDTNPACAFVNCYIYGNYSGSMFSCTYGNATFGYNKKMFGLFNCVLDDNHGGYYGLLETNHNCDVYNTFFFNSQFTSNAWRDKPGFQYSKPTNPAPTEFPVVKNCAFTATNASNCVNNSSVVQENNLIGMKPLTAYTNGESASDATYGASTTSKDFWDVTSNASNEPCPRYNDHLLLQDSPTPDGRTKDAGTMDMLEVMKPYFSIDYPNFHIFSDGLAYRKWATPYSGDTEYRRVRGSSLDIGCSEYTPYQLGLSVSPDYTAEDEGFGTTKFNTIPDAITYYVQNHQGVDYTGCKVVVEKDMEVSAFDWTSALQLTSATQMFVICGRRAKPLVRNPQVKLTISSGSSPMFNLDDCVATGSVPDGIEFRDIEFVCNQSNPSHGQSAKAIELTEDCGAKLLLTRCKFSSENPVSMYLCATCDSAYAQNQPSRIIVDNCAFNGPALVLRTDGTNNVAFVNTTFDLTGYESASAVTISGASSVVQRFYNCGFWNCPSLSSNKDFEMWNTFVFKSANDGWTSGSKFTNCATDLASFGSATATSCKYGLNPNNQFVSSGRYGGLKFFPKEGSDLITGATDDVLKDMSIYVYGGMMPEQYDPIGTGRPDR